MQERLASEHGGELFRNAFEYFLYGRCITDKGGRHAQSSGCNVTYSHFHIVWNPFHEVAAVFVLNAQHLGVDFFH